MAENELEKDLKKIEDKMFQVKQNFRIAMKTGSVSEKEERALLSFYNGIETLYQQNQIIIGQNREIIEYFKEQKK